MKNSLLFLPLLGCAILAASLLAQTNTTTATAPSTSTNFAVVARTPYSRQWVKILSQTNQDGSVTLETNSAYTELGTGLCYTNAAGQLVDADPTINIVADGAEATQTQHKVHWMGNINTAGGSVHLVSPGGNNFVSRVYGLSFWDTALNTNILIASLQDSQGQLVSSNRIVYSNAFDHVQADIEYVQRKSGLEQNIILRQNLPSPTNFGLNPQTTRLEVLTEFFSPPPATNTSVVREGIKDDKLINFGDTAIGIGRAFKVGDDPANSERKLGMVSKHWRKIEGRDFLIEEVPYRFISNAVESLPPQASATNGASQVIGQIASLLPLLPAKTASAAKSEPILLARGATDKPGVVIDYTTVSGYAFNYSFLGWGGDDYPNENTYYVSSELDVQGQTTFYGGAVIKGGPICNYDGSNPFSFEGNSTQPTIFTSPNDNSVGDPIYGSSGTPSASDVSGFLVEGISLGSNSTTTVEAVLFSFATTAYTEYQCNYLMVMDCQFVECGLAMWDPGATNLYLGNDLFATNGVIPWPGGTAIAIQGGDWTNLCVEMDWVTADGMETLVSDGYPVGGGSNAFNCIFTGCDGSETNMTLVDCWDYANNGGVFASGGDNNYYLSMYNHGGATAYVNDTTNTWKMEQLTTYPPQQGSYLDTYASDLGFHYPPDTSYIDGVPDWWEMEYFGTAGYRGGDADYRGQSLWYEYYTSSPPINFQFTVFTPMQ